MRSCRVMQLHYVVQGAAPVTVTLTPCIVFTGGV